MSYISDATVLIDEMRAKIAYKLRKETNTTWLITVDREVLDYHFHMKTAFPKRFDKSSRELPEIPYARISQSLSILALNKHTVPLIVDRIVDDAYINYFCEKERLENNAN